jgi:transposase
MNQMFRPCSLDQLELVTTDLRTWIADDHLALFVDRIVDELDLSDFISLYSDRSRGGRPPYSPYALLKILVYGYMRGIRTSRGLEQATKESIPFRMLAGGEQPDHDTIASFRKRFMLHSAAMFQRVLDLCAAEGLAEMETVATDGSKVLANASKHKAMSYDRMVSTLPRLEQEIEDHRKEISDAQREKRTTCSDGKSVADHLREIKRRTRKASRIREAMRCLEERAQNQASTERVRELRVDGAQATQAGDGYANQSVTVLIIPDPKTAIPAPKAQFNFTDPDSRIMRDGASKGFVQAYNAQIVVDSKSQVIVAADITQQANDINQLVPMVSQAMWNVGKTPKTVLADAGYFSAENVQRIAEHCDEVYIPPGRLKRDDPKKDTGKRAAKSAAAAAMREKLKTDKGRRAYSRRKAIVEPVFGQIKERMKFRSFSFRGTESARNEWRFVCAVHNLLKLYRKQSACRE